MIWFRTGPARGRASRLAGCAVCLLLAAAENPAWRTGSAFHKALEQPVTVVQQNAELRDLLSRLAAVQQTACVLDRRIDPSSQVTLEMQQSPLQDTFVEAARQVHAECLPLGNTLIVGRAPDLDRLLSQAEALQKAIKADQSLSAARRIQLARDYTLAWQDLDRPRDVLAEISRRWDLSLVNPEAVPHDLWAAGSAAGVDAVQALSLVLGQFDLSFRIASRGTAVEIIPLPERVAVERPHRPLGLSMAEATEAIRSGWPQATVLSQGAGLAVSATVLEHAAIARRLGEVREVKPVLAAPPPLNRRRFPKVKIVRKPASEVLAALRAQGITVIYDADALRRSGVNLATLVSLEFDNATAEEFFRALCAQLRLDFAIDGSAVTLRPR